MERSLELMSPEAVLRKGFAIVSKGGKAATAGDLHPGDEIKITLIDGEVNATIKV